MASPRELAEKAFALLQNALSESEAKASDLDEQLKRKKAPKTRIEDQLEVLTHRLEGVEAERLRWEQQAGHLEEIAEAERVKVAQLKKKLEIAESGPDKLTKKEVNFWRAKSETIDAQIKEYQDRLMQLRRELIERDELIDKLQASGGAANVAPERNVSERAAPEHPAPERAAPERAPKESDSELRRQLDQRDQWLAELRLELHELRGQPAPPLETQAEVETLRGQITNLERSLAESHNLRAAAQAELMRAGHELAARERTLRETSGTGERAKTTLAEREHRIAELSAEVEQLRNELRQRGDSDREDATRYEEQIAALTRDADALRSRIEQDKHDNGSARAALELALHEREQEIEKQRQLQAANERDFTELKRQLAEREQATADLRDRIEEQRQEIVACDTDLKDREQQLQDLNERLKERDERAQAAGADLDHVRATLTAQGQEIESLRDLLAAAERELEEGRLTVADAVARAETAVRDMESVREQAGGLEAELKEERENAESLGELANERREHMTKLQEQVEEAEERYADANWRLGKSLHFERIVKRRKGLIKKLLDALRAKMKANAALKAGVDGLRTYKQTAEMNQHKLLQRIDGLKAEVQEAQEAVKRHQGATAVKEEVVNATARATALEERLNTQAELIQSLEADLKTARLSQKSVESKTGKTQQVERLSKEMQTQAELIQALESELKSTRLTLKAAESKAAESKAVEAKAAAESKSGKTQEVEKLMKELEAKNQTIAELQVYADEQQKKVARLRSSESETMRLKALTEKGRGEVEALTTEVTQLREALAAAPPPDQHAELEAKVGAFESKLKERENGIARLMATVKEHEATIKRLTESSESWKRKYQFLATDQPDAYKNAAEK
jgi:chromosome segregation ATPase